MYTKNINICQKKTKDQNKMEEDDRLELPLINPIETIATVISANQNELNAKKNQTELYKKADKGPFQVMVEADNIQTDSNQVEN